MLIRHSAECWTDHKLLCTKLSLKVQWRRVRRFKRRKYVVALLRDNNIEGWMPEEGTTSKWCACVKGLCLGSC